MFLEIHDAEEGNSLCGVARSIDYTYQAEQWVIDTAKEEPKAVRWVLFSDEGTPLREWVRNSEGVEEARVSPAAKADPRSFRN